MNKKILSIFALIMALSFAVSCSNEESTGTGGNNNQTEVLKVKLDSGAGTKTTPLEADVDSAGDVVIDTAINVVADGDDSITDGVTYAVTKVEGLAANTLTGAAFELASLSGDAVKIEYYTLAIDTGIKPKLTIKATAQAALKTAIPYNSAAQIGGIKLTVLAKKGNAEKQLEVYVKVTGAAS